VFKLAPYTRKSDLFSVGVIYYAIVSNSSPFRAETYEGLIEKNKKCDVSFQKRVWDNVG
jgi:serine/threonine protein kinase